MAALRLPVPPTAAATWGLQPPSATTSALWLSFPGRDSPRPLAARRGKGQDRTEAPPVRTLLIDNYDSYTYNIFQELSVVNGVPPVVVRNDEWSWRDVYTWVYKERAFDNVVISPGPGSPACPSDIGICLRILCECGDIPTLGVCLGHQALGLVHGAKIVHAPEAIHGRLSEIEHNGCNLFNHIPSGIDSGFKVVRYHSLVIEESSLPKDLVSIAWTASPKMLSFLESDQPDSTPYRGSLNNLSLTNPSDYTNNGEVPITINNASNKSDLSKIIMAIKHSSRPHYGVQFHPESVATHYGRQIFQNFRRITVEFDNNHRCFRKVKSADQCNYMPKGLLHTERLELCDSVGFRILPARSSEKKFLRLRWRKLDNYLSRTGGSEAIFSTLFGHQKAEDTFWLDSSSVDQVVRYHSLVIEESSLPKDLVSIAWTASPKMLSFLESDQPDSTPYRGSLNNLSLTNPSDYTNNGEVPITINNASNKSDLSKIIMAIKHSSRPHYRVQFHPESVATHYGRQIFQNFRRITVEFDNNHRCFRKVTSADQCNYIPKGLLHNERLELCDPVGFHMLPQRRSEKKFIRLRWRKIDNYLSRAGGSEAIFSTLFGHQKAEDTFWLDSSSVDQNRARFSFMGGKGGPLWKQMTFHLSNQRANCGGTVTVRGAHGSVVKNSLKDGFLEFLNKEIESIQFNEHDFEGLPFDFHGGFVGYLGYGLKVECDASSNKAKSNTPDACFFFVDNLVVVDHKNGDVYILSLHDECSSSNGDGVYTPWLVETEKRLLRIIAMAPGPLINLKSVIGSSNMNKKIFVVEKSKDQYIKDVQSCLDYIRNGESYELCLTTRMRRGVEYINALELYLKLRKQNPAPYAAWLNFSSENLSICCSSPERFLSLDQNAILEAKPIKGTIGRGRTPEEDECLRLQLKYSEKDQAENLMIVDLLRNDLGKVCEPGSVHVPRLMDVESYKTVHTMVSTIRGTKKPDLSPVDCVKSAFPGGSMTGAPKVRSMEILDSLESSPRGIYSGSIGFFSYNRTFDLNIVIRTVILHDGEATVGAGGAIVALSDPEAEYAEMMLKARTPTLVVE